MTRKAEHEKPPVAAWAARKRHERRWRYQDTLNALGAVREPISESYLRAIEGGSKNPSPPVLAALEQVYADKAPDSTKEPRPEWAEALIDEVGTIRLLLEAVATRQAAAVDQLGEVLARLPQPASGPADGQAQSQPDDTHGR